MPDVAKQKAQFLEAVDGALLKALPKASPEQIETLRGWLHPVVKKAEAHYLKLLDPQRLIGQAKSTLTFAAQRAPDAILVRAFNPTLAEHGYESDFTVVETAMTDQPFLLDTVRMVLRERDLREHLCHHPILEVERAADGKMVGFAPDDGGPKESWMHFELERVTDPAQLSSLADLIRGRLERSRVVVADHRRMLRQLTTAINNLVVVAGERPALNDEIEEICEFLRWLGQDNFIFLGYEEFKFDGQKTGLDRLEATTNRLGLRRPELVSQADWPLWPSAAEGFLDGDSLVTFVKDDVDSTVHRAGKLDTLILRQIDEAGQTVAIQLLNGLLTYKAVSTEGATLPLLRRNLKTLLRREEAEDGSHQYKAIIAAFNSLPVEFLYHSDVDSLQQAVRMISTAEVDKKAQVFLQRAPNARSAFLLLSMPTEGWEDSVRQTLAERLFQSLGATYVDDRISFNNEHDNVVATFFITSNKKLKDVEASQIERELLALTLTWEDKFASELLGKVKASVFDGLHKRYLDSLPKRYQLVTSPAEGVEDILALERLHTSGELQFRVSKDGEAGPTCKLKIYQRDTVFLTESLPILANFGLNVIEQASTTITVPDGTSYVMDTFRVTAQGDDVDLMGRAADLAEGLRAVLTGKMESDLLNRLLLLANLTSREVDALRAYVSCARQIEAHFPLEYTRRVWVNHKRAARLLIDLLTIRFDPDLAVPAGETREGLVKACQERFASYLQSVDNAAEDRILRTVYSLVNATVRINYYRRPTREFISFKMDSSKVANMPSPRPFREIFVHHSHVEGVHLRGGPIARGGLRWSDRFDDYRTEVLGLMRTQMVKNTVIVPVGSKGGFVLKKQYATREEERAQADILYKTFISGLLDLTDNLVDNKVVPPDRVVRYDDDDPYLVVAADKGTAHLSDTANSISRAYGFWLGDAFASGGSNGYDHKKEAITARGGWECVKRLFQEMGIDPERDVITVSGIGDMAGDVFGNGLLLSKTVKLLAAFNHMHIFLDPNPDPALSWAERHRMFNLPRSTWDDYDRSKMSAGGGIYRRTAKAIPLSPEVRQMLGVEAETLTGDETIRAILKMKVDLLWNGGIGTYVKAHWQTDRDVNDRVNDPVRVDARDLGCRVVGEGGNLGMTQAARIEFASKGGRLNTDFLDNSAGVDMSDHEVNLKLLFGRLMSAGRMTLEERNAFLVSLTDEVGKAVLSDNFSQSRAVSLDEIRSRKDLSPFMALIENLDREGVAKREMESLPSQEELDERQRAGRGLVRPELAILLAFTKMRIYNWLLADERFKGEVVQNALISYFPTAVQERYRSEILEHPLRKEITATVLTTRIVDNAGSTFFQEVWEDTSFSVPEVAMAYLIASTMLGAHRLEASLASLEGKVDSDILYHAQITIEDALNSLTRRMLRRGFDVFDPDTVINRYTRDFSELHFTLVDVLPQAALEGVVRQRDTYIEAGLPESLAQELATFPHLVSGGDIAILTEESGLDLPTSAWLYHAVGEEVHARSAQAMASPSGVANRWEKTALHVVRGKLIDAQYNIALKIARSHTAGPNRAHPVRDSFQAYFDSRRALLQRARAMEGRIRSSKADGLAPATVMAEVIEEMAAER